MNTSDLALLAIFILLIFFVVTRFREALQKWHDREFLAIWLFALCFASGSLLELSKVHIWFDALIGLNNFSWFVSRLFFVFSAYFFARKCVTNYSARYLDLSKWMKYGLLSTQFAITFFYWRGLDTASEHNYFSSLIAIDQTSLVIHALAFSFIFIMLSTLAHFYYRLFREERVSLMRIMWLAHLFFSLDALLLIAIRLYLATMGFLLNLPDSIITPLSMLAQVTLLLLVFWPLIFSPNWAHILFTKPVMYLESLLTLHRLMALLRTAQALPVELDTPMPLNLSLWEYIQKPQMNIYKIMIALLDYKSSLKTYPLVTDENSWVKEWLSIDDNTDYQSQVKNYANLGQKLQKGNGRSTL